MKKLVALLLVLCSLLTLVFATAEDFSALTPEDFEAMDWSGKTVQYHFHWIPGKSYGGAFNPENAMGYVTDIMPCFMDLYDDGTLCGYFMDSTGHYASPELGYDMENRLASIYVGWWTQEGETITFNFYRLSKDSDKNLLVQTCTFENGVAYYEFDRLGSGTEDFSPYTLFCDGTIPEETGMDLVDSVNYDFDEAMAG